MHSVDKLKHKNNKIKFKELQDQKKRKRFERREKKCKLQIEEEQGWIEGDENKDGLKERRTRMD